MSLTPARARALTILRDHPRVGPTAFAKLMWPTSKGHTTRSHRRATPAGGAVGAGIKMSAGAFLGRLWDSGLATRSRNGLGRDEFSLSPAGRAELEEHERARSRT